MKSFKNISNFRSINKIFKIDILNYDFEDVLLPSNSFKYFSGLSASKIKKIKWNSTKSLILINQTSNVGIKTPFPLGLQCIAVQTINSIDQDLYLNAGE